MLRLSGLALPLDHAPDALPAAICARLGIEPAGRLSPDLRQAVIDRKGALLALLRAEAFPPRNPFANPRPLAVCDRCGDDYIDVPIHDGQGTRRDCRRCNRFLGWTRWHGRTHEDQQ